MKPPLEENIGLLLCCVTLMTTAQFIGQPAATVANLATSSLLYNLNPLDNGYGFSM